MAIHPGPAAVLLVDRDPTIRAIVGRVLQREGYTILLARDAATALQLAQKHRPPVALLDLCLGSDDDFDLVDRLHAPSCGVGRILLTGYPLRHHGGPGLERPFLRVLAKPFDLKEFRRAVKSAHTEGIMDQSHSSNAPQSVPPPPPTEGTTVVLPVKHGVQFDEMTHHKPTKAAIIGSGIILLIVLSVLTGFIIFVVLGVPVPGMANEEEQRKVRREEGPRVDLVPGQALTVSVPEISRTALGLRKGGIDQIATARQLKSDEGRPLVLSGSTMLDPSYLLRIRVRFTPAEVREIGITEALDIDEFGYEHKIKRPLRSGDIVHKGQRLVLFHSDVVGNKKNDLIDAMSQMKLDKEILDASQLAFDKASLSALDLLAAKRAVQGDFNTIERAEYTLRAWGIPEQDIKDVRAEAEEIIKTGGKQNLDPEVLRKKLDKWAKVDLLVPDELDGAVITEQNLAVRELAQDPTLILIQLTKMDRLLVTANASEENLPRLHALNDSEMRWTIHAAGADEGLEGRINDVGCIIDPAIHSAIVKGYIKNKPDPKRPGHYLLEGGQKVTATVRMHPPENVVEIPSSALADDGKQVVVFVQSDDKKPGVYTMRRVEIVQRLDHTVFVRSAYTNGLEEQPRTLQEEELGLLPRGILKPGEKVITAGVLEIKKELEDRQSEAEAAKK